MPAARPSVVARLLWRLLLWSIVLVGAAAFAGLELPIETEEAIERELARRATPQAIEARIESALARDDVEEARLFLSFADERGAPVPPSLRAQVRAADAPGAAARRGAAEFGLGFATGEGTTIAGLAGAVASDLTVVGDLRDVFSEGARMMAGEPYDEIILGLAALGVVATGATVATGGGGLPAKVGISTLKVARRAGTLTAELGYRLGRAVREAVDFSALGAAVTAVARLDTAASRAAVETAVRRAATGDLARMTNDARQIANTIGTGETVRLLRYAKTPEDLTDLSVMSNRFGRNTRAVVELTGRTSLRAFRHAVRISALLIEHIQAVLAWFGSLITMIFTRKLWIAVKTLRAA